MTDITVNQTNVIIEVQDNAVDVVLTRGGKNNLSELNDVELSSPATNEVLKYNGSAWVNGSSSATVNTLNDIGDVVTSGQANNDFLVFNGTNWVNETSSAARTSLGLSTSDAPTFAGQTITGAAVFSSTVKGIAKEACFVASDQTVDLSTGDGKAYIVIPASFNGMNLVRVRSNVITAGTTGTSDFQIHNLTQAADMLSTKLTIDSGGTSSGTAVTPAVIDTNNDDVATGDVLRLDIDAVSTTAPKGLFLIMEFDTP